MRSSVTSSFSGPSGFLVAMQDEGFLDCVVTHKGRFQAGLIQVALERLRLFAAKESLPRIARIKTPKDRILISLPLDGRSSQFWGGARVDAETLVTLGPGTSVHTRTDGPSHWGAIWFPIDAWARYTQALTGEILTIPDFACLWRPPAAARRLLHHILADVMRAAQIRPEALSASEAAHGLDQQLIHSLIECLLGPRMNDDIPIRRQRHTLIDRFDKLVATDLLSDVRVASISQVLGVSDRFLRQCCEEQLGMNPMRYLKLRRLHSVHCALQGGDPVTLRVSDAARRSGFRHLGRFAAEYRHLFGESPSVTLRQQPHQTMPGLASPRRAKHSSSRTPIEINQCGG
jgi:AraC-like DNA-binding protein